MYPLKQKIRHFGPVMKHQRSEADLFYSYGRFILARAPLEYSAERAPRGGDRFCPPPLPNSLTDGRSNAGEGQSKTLDEYFFNIKKNLSRSHVRPRSGQRSKSSLFALSATETGLIAAANPNFAIGLPKG